MPKRERENNDTMEEDVPEGLLESDSDEDDEDASEVDKYNILKEDDIDGQEEQTQEFDGEVQITPFNMKEEMEEGYFDKEGHYILNKQGENEVKDSWLDNIDWVKVNANSSQKNELSNNDDDSDLPDVKKFDPIDTYKEILSFLSPGESILKALKRLGGGKTLTASQRWKMKKEGKLGSGSSNSAEQNKIVQLTELADRVLSELGNMDVYQETYESIKYKMQLAESKTKISEPEQDMFGEDFSETLNPATTTKTIRNESTHEEPQAKRVRFNEDTKKEENTEETAKHQEVLWEFKWKNVDDSEVHGPHSTTEMMNWVTEGYFSEGVWVRRVGQEEFYNSRRVDFDLYL